MIFNVKMEDERKIGIYKMENTITKKIYIGQTRTSFRRRYLQHINSMKLGRRESKYILEDCEKYGINSFVFSIVEILDDANQLNDREIFYINEYNAIGNGYNKKMQGSYVVKNYTSEKQKERKNKVTDEFKKYRSEYMKNRVVSQGTKDRLRFANLGSKSPVAVLNEDIVVDIKKRLVNGDRILDISNDTGIKYATINSVSNGRAWSHIYVDGFDEYIKSKKTRHRMTEKERQLAIDMVNNGYSQSEAARRIGCYSSTICELMKRYHQNLQSN